MGGHILGKAFVSIKHKTETPLIFRWRYILQGKLSTESTYLLWYFNHLSICSDPGVPEDCYETCLLGETETTISSSMKRHSFRERHLDYICERKFGKVTEWILSVVYIITIILLPPRHLKISEYHHVGDIVIKTVQVHDRIKCKMCCEAHFKCVMQHPRLSYCLSAVPQQPHWKSPEPLLQDWMNVL